MVAGGACLWGQPGLVACQRVLRSSSCFGLQQKSLGGLLVRIASPSIVQLPVQLAAHSKRDCNILPLSLSLSPVLMLILMLIDQREAAGRVPGPPPSPKRP